MKTPEEFASDSHLRDLVKPLFLYMYDHGIAYLEISKDGTTAHMNMTLDVEHDSNALSSTVD